MAFVYRTEKQEQVERAKTPGPGSYDPLQQMKTTNSASGFYNKVPRKLWTASTNPGPGEYKVEGESKKFEGQTIIYNQADLAFCLTDALIKTQHGCSSNFKSTSKRMVMKTNNTPGPGEYNIQAYEIGQKQFQRTPSAVQKPTKLTRYLYEEAKKQNLYVANNQNRHQQSYSQHINPKFNDQSNKQNNPLQEKPKKQQLKHNYQSVFSSKVDRQLSVRPQTTTGVGPGSYNIIASYNALDRKTVNHKSPQIDCEKQIKFVSSQLEEKAKIGPGYYQIQSSSFCRPQTSYSKGIACFGSKQSRFNKSRIQSNSRDVGPQSYFKRNLKKEYQQQYIKNKKKIVGFNSSVANSHQYVQLKSSTNQTQVSPCSYYPRTDFNELLKKNFTKGYIGNFGSKVERFKSTDNQTQTSLTNTIANDKLQFGNYENRVKTAKNISKARINRSTCQFNTVSKDKTKIEDYRPLCYDINYQTINSKFNRKQQKKVPFMTGSERFQQQLVDYQATILSAIEAQQKSIIKIKGNGEKPVQKSKIYKGKPHNQSIIGKYLQASKQSRDMEGFLQQNQRQKQIIGPQTYNPALIPKKKSYNVLFKQ